ncbi:S-layer homology domain-containing protein [Paenibacillus sp. NPDC056579]|uniref:S-layer homology domain-containing protein n=1 Tax=Paenibacillus sp. NPDC056579 TaxID=3345871 RepID=UPI00368984A6
MGNKFMLTLLVGLSAALCLPAAASADVIKYDLPARSKEQIKAKWRAYSPNQFQGEPYAEKPVLTVPFKAGRIAPSYLQGGVARANWYRFLSGLPEDLELSEELSESAQHAAVVTAATYGTTFPIKYAPDEMKDGFYKMANRLADRSQFIWTNDTMPNLLATSVDYYMDTSDMSAKEPNAQKLTSGVPLQILNPKLKKIGLGLAPGEGFRSYSVLFLEDDSRNADFRYSYISYPSPGHFPADLFRNDQSWAILLNSSLFQRPIRLNIELKRHSDQKTWTLREGTLILDQQLIDEASGTQRIMFKPRDLDPIKEDDTFTVKVTGLTKVDKDEAELSYDVQFFYINRPAGEQNPESAEPPKPDEAGSGASKPETSGNPGTAKPGPSVNPPAPVTFSDTKGHWAEETIRWGAENKVVDGYPDGTFRPDLQVSEEDFLRMLLKTSGDGNNSVDERTETDRLYEIAVKNKLPVNGANDGLVRKAAITREKVAELIAAATGNPALKDEAVVYVLAKAYATGRRGADVDGYAGQEPLTRAEALQFIKNLHDQRSP